MSPFGSSHFDFLPEDVVERIFKDKHSIEFQTTLDTIKKFRYAMCKDDLWFARQPIRELLRPISKRKIFFIHVEEYAGDMFFTTDVNKVSAVEKQMNVKVALKHAYTVRINWQSKEPMRVLDVICISKALDLNSLSRHYILENVRVERDDISFVFA